MSIKLALVTVDFHGHEDTLELLQSCRKLDWAGTKFKFFVVDNGSSTPLPKHLEKDFPGVKVLRTGTNKGFAGGFNVGLKAAYKWGADFVLIVNNDVLFGDKKIIGKLLDTFSNKDAGVVAPKIYFAPGFEYRKDKYKKKDIGRVIWFAGGTFDWKTFQSEHWGLDEVDGGKYDLIEETSTLCGCCVMIKREVLEKVGYFDEDYFAYYEDNDYLVRLIRKGFKSFYNGKTFIYHKVSRTAGIGSPWSDYFLVRNKFFFGLKYANFKTRLFLLGNAFYYLFRGRPMQKRGALDFFLGRMGAPDWLKLSKWMLRASHSFAKRGKIFNSEILLNSTHMGS